MLVTRQCDTEANRWSSKLETVFPTTDSPRMSNFEAPLSTQPDWQGHYSFLAPGDGHIFGQSYEQVPTSSNGNVSSAEQVAAGIMTTDHSGHSAGSVSPGNHGRMVDASGLRQPKVESPTQDQPDLRIPTYTIKEESGVEDALAVPGLSLPPHPLTLITPADTVPSVSPKRNSIDESVVGKDEDDDLIDDEDLSDEDGEGGSQTLTAAERTAARRKMKRFRLTHQQTRFLMSEFAKQPHPDAAHRERLSREIPGLSPRQVQVWFQNRRAKIKRLTVDDRERMIKMRAVPDDFDNVQALHSPYGAVHGLGTPMASPVDYSSSAYAEHMMRPLMIDPMRRAEGDDHMSPTGLSPAFGSIGFASSGPMSATDILSPLSPSSNERGYYSSHLTSPMSGPRSANPFARQNSLDAGMALHGHSRQQMRSLQPLQIRETMSRSRSDTLQSPLRSSMSWKGDSIDYASYQGSAVSPGSGARHQALYPPDQMGGSSNSLTYDAGSYNSTGLQPSPPHLNYSTLSTSGLQTSPQNRSRLRAASATLPLGLDLRTQYRSVTSGHTSSLQNPAQTSTPRAASTTPYGNSSAYSASFPSAPLTAPVDFSLPRTPGVRPLHDYSNPQMSAPIAPPNDFTQALHNMSNPSSRTPMRDSFGAAPAGISQGHDSSERGEEYVHDSNSLKRKRSISVTQGGHRASVSGPPAYGHSG